jgi:sphingomyelin phosphodiesterase acid-like 3
VSDIHFEPFWDPDKVAQLVTAPVGAWRTILSSAPSQNQAQRFDQLQQSCHAKGVDTPFALFDSSLHAMRENGSGAAFAVLSGDLIAHSFSCKYATLFPDSSPEQYRKFVEKTLQFVTGELRASLPNAPLFAALGNNDSDCGDYRIDANSAFLAEAAGDFTSQVAGAERKKAQRDFASGGNYSVPLPAPLRNARLLVLDDLFLSRRYTACSGKPDAKAASEQIAWLRNQLAFARGHKEKVWVVAHIPTGVDPFATILKAKNVCGGQAPEMFLASDELTEILTEFGDVVRLVLFAHTHMDELRLLRPALAGKTAGKEVAGKLVPSISPIRGNNPSFLLAGVDAASATMTNYRVISATDKTGAAWHEEYDFDRAYDVAEFTPDSLNRIIAEFEADPSAKSRASQAYLKSYFKDAASIPTALFWPEYVCALSNTTAGSFGSCFCKGDQ